METIRQNDECIFARSSVPIITKFEDSGTGFLILLAAEWLCMSQTVPRHVSNRTSSLSFFSVILAITMMSTAIPYLQLIIIGVSAFLLSRTYFGMVLAVSLLEGILTGQVQTIFKFLGIWMEMIPPSDRFGFVTLFMIGSLYFWLLPLALGKRFSRMLKKRTNMMIKV